MLTFLQFAESAGSGDKTDISWHYHPALGPKSIEGFHKHAELRQHNPDFKDAYYTSNAGGSRLYKGFATIHHPSKSVEVHDYGEKWQDGTPNKDVKQHIFNHLKDTHRLNGYKMVKAKEATSLRRDRPDGD